MLVLRWTRIFVLPATILALLTGSIGAQAAQLFNETVPLNVTVFNPCSGEFIAFSGNAHFVGNETSTPSGGFHFEFAVNVSDLMGVGLSTGAQYTGVGGDWFEFNAVPPFPFSTTETDVFGLIAHGSSVASLMVTATFHITVDAQGNLTSSVSNLRISCPA